MKVVHIESGLGNQMLDYCEYLALRHAQPTEICYIETLIFDIPECDEVFSHWNGYELDKVFGIRAPNIRELFTAEQWNNILLRIKKSRFWLKNWNWPVYFCEAFRAEGLELNNIRGDFEQERAFAVWLRKLTQTRLYDTAPAVWLRKVYQICLCNSAIRTYRSRKRNKYLKSDADILFYKGTEDALTGHRLGFQRRNNHIEAIDREIRQAFQFPQLADQKNRSFSKYIKAHESVAIHVRRGDMLRFNSRYYTTGYFKRAVKYMKKKIPNPVFIFFCDPGSGEYCRKNLNVFSLSEKDQIHFVNWNAGRESYRDMQLMSLCKHNIITNSSFGWWGAYLNENPNKITISPEIEINTTHHF